MLARLVAGSSILVALGSSSRPAHAQGGGDTFFRASDIGVAGAFALGSYAVSRFDPTIAKYFQKPEQQRNPTLRRLADGFTNIQETTLTIAGIVAYGAARVTHAHAIETTALHATESIVAASLTSQVIRGPLGRARPKDALPIFEDQYEFHWFSGFRHFQYRAFPSIHSSSSFAAATVLVTELHYRSPRTNWVVAPVAFVLAAGPGYSRMYLGQHWASDVFMGAFLGAFYGERIVNYAHAHPDNRVDRLFLGKNPKSPTSIVPISLTVRF